MKAHDAVHLFQRKDECLVFGYAEVIRLWSSSQMKENSTGQIHPEMSVAELLSGSPQAVMVFLRYHMACIGCSMAAFETLAEAARIYKIPLERLVSELQVADGR